MRADIAQAVAYTEMVKAQEENPNLKDLNWWLTHPYVACPMETVSRTTYDWVVTHRAFPPRSSVKQVNTLITTNSNSIMHQLADEFNQATQSHGVNQKDNEEYFLCKGYNRGLSYAQLAFVINQSEHYVRRAIHQLITRQVIKQRGLKERRHQTKEGERK